ncbi:MAG: hypothetical protein Q7U54_10505 [Bacteroidales bacterium]|nr:hypothetical protein [Bacteroidales bacterium]
MKTKKLTSFLPVNDLFTKDLIVSYYTSTGESLSPEALRVKIARLKSKGIIISVSRGLYRLNDKKQFEPQLNPSIIRIDGKIKKSFPFLNYMIWKTDWLNNFSRLQLYRTITVIEVEAGSEDAVFGMVKESYPSKTYLNPTENDWRNYMSDRTDSIVIKTMVSESPKEVRHHIRIARLEKILVDIYFDRLWQIVFKSELINIFHTACSEYAVNFSTLLSYAARRGRGKREEIWEFIKSMEVLDITTIKMIEN